MPKRTMKILLALAALMLTSGVTLQAGDGRHKAQKVKEAGWYMRTRVAATAEDGTVYAHNSAGVFGELIDSLNGYDRHDIPSYGPAVLQIVFPHYHWGEESGDYWSDYRKYKKKRKYRRRVWTFLVRNQKRVDLSHADLRIELDEAKRIEYIKENGHLRYKEVGTDPKMRERMTLVDVDNNQTYSVKELPYANLNMEGKHTRTFRWVRGPVKRRDFEPVQMP